MKSAPCCLLLLAVGLTAQSVPEGPAVNKLNSTLLPLALLPKVPKGNDFFGIPLQKSQRCLDCERVPEFRQFTKISQQVVDDIMSFADRYHKPNSNRVLEFANALTSLLAGRDLPIAPLSQLTASIVETLDYAVEFAAKRDFKGKNFMNKKSDSEDRFSASVIRAKKALIALGVSAPEAQVVSERLAWMGKSVWSPHFTPVE